MIDARKILAERVNELCKEKKLTYEELSSKSEVPIETVLQIADGSVKIQEYLQSLKFVKDWIFH